MQYLGAPLNDGTVSREDNGLAYYKRDVDRAGHDGGWHGGGRGGRGRGGGRNPRHDRRSPPKQQQRVKVFDNDKCYFFPPPLSGYNPKKGLQFEGDGSDTYYWHVGYPHARNKDGGVWLKRRPEFESNPSTADRTASDLQDAKKRKFVCAPSNMSAAIAQFETAYTFGDDKE